MSGPSDARAGFADPVHDAQATFRAVLDAMARPGSIQPVPRAACVALRTAPLPQAMAAAILTLADHETPVWLDADLAARSEVASFIRFASGAKLVDDPESAAFALVADVAAMPPISAFARGTPEYPDRSTTIIASVGGLSNDQAGPDALHLTGAGIDGHRILSVSRLPSGLVAQLEANRAHFPLGVDLILCGSLEFAALPRHVRIAACAQIGEVR